MFMGVYETVSEKTNVKPKATLPAPPDSLPASGDADAREGVAFEPLVRRSSHMACNLRGSRVCRPSRKDRRKATAPHGKNV